MKHEYFTQGVCPVKGDFDLNGDIVTNIEFTGGCNGNLKALSKLLDGMKAEEINEKLRGNLCGRRPTSCADQLAMAVMEN